MKLFFILLVYIFEGGDKNGNIYLIFIREEGKNKLGLCEKTAIKYKIYESDENVANIEYREAKRMING